jgi:hypothetical protein
MAWDHLQGKPRPRRADKQSLFVVNYRDGTKGFVRVPPQLATFGASPPVMRLAHERQAKGELPNGEIVRLVRVR